MGLSRTRCGPLVALFSCLVAACSVTACSGDNGDAEPSLERTGTEVSPAPAAFQVTMQPQDSIIFAQRIAWAQEQRLDTVPIGAAIAALGRTFVGTRYTPGTLELEGPERLIVNLRELDCVTFVENMLAMARVLHAGTPDFESFKRELVRIRYRDGVLTGYPSRLHYFSEWIADNEAKGIVEDVTASLGGELDRGDISFMTRNPDAYRQFADTAVSAAIARIELELSGRDRYYIPEDRVDGIAEGIRDGDIIAATSTLEGLDIAHTGIALHVDGEVRLMHAPLVGSHVQISDRPIGERLQGIDAQDGIMVARPLPVDGG